MDDKIGGLFEVRLRSGRVVAARIERVRGGGYDVTLPNGLRAYTADVLRRLDGAVPQAKENEENDR